MNCHGQLTGRFPPAAIRPLTIDVQMEYELDKKLFPGLNDPVKSKIPALMIDLTRDDKIEKKQKVDDDNIVQLLGMYTLKLNILICNIILKNSKIIFFFFKFS